MFGECRIECSRNSEGFKRDFGGDTQNTARYHARLMNAAQLSVDQVEALETDSFSDQLIAAGGRNRYTRLIQRLENNIPGLYIIETDVRGERSFCYWRRA